MPFIFGNYLSSIQKFYGRLYGSIIYHHQSLCAFHIPPSYRVWDEGGVEGVGASEGLLECVGSREVRKISPRNEIGINTKSLS